MKVLFLGAEPPSVRAGLDPRRRNLYGDDVICLVPEEPSASEPLPYRTISIGPLWQPGSTRFGARVAAPDLVERVAAVCARHPDGALVVGRHELAEALIGTRLRFAFDPTDSASLFYFRRLCLMWRRSPLKAINSLRLHRRFRRLEMRIGAAAAVFVTTGPADEAHLRQLCPSANVLRIGNGTRLIAEPVIEPQHDGRTVGFHGGMLWEPNRTTAEQLAGPVARALAAGPGAPVRIRIAGTPVPPKLATRQGRDGVEACGFVEDLRAWMASLSLYLMPMYQGGGVKNKLIEAMAVGLPVLTNQLGAEALDAEGRACIAVAQSDADLARMVLALLADPAQLARMRVAGRAYAERHLDWASHRAALHAELARLKAAGQL